MWAIILVSRYKHANPSPLHLYPGLQPSLFLPASLLTVTPGARLPRDLSQSRNNSRKNEGMEPKQKQYPVVDGTGDRSKVRCCKEQYCTLEAAQGAPRDPRRDSRGERSPWLPLETRPDSPGAKAPAFRRWLSCPAPTHAWNRTLLPAREAP